MIKTEKTIKTSAGTKTKQNKTKQNKQTTAAGGHSLTNDICGHFRQNLVS